MVNPSTLVSRHGRPRAGQDWRGRPQRGRPISAQSTAVPEEFVRVPRRGLVPASEALLPATEDRR